MKKISAFLTAALLTFTFSSFAQTTSRVKGDVKDESQKPVSGITVSLLRGKDSSLVKAAITDKDGLYSFESIKNGSYLLGITSVGYQKKFSGVIDVKEGAEITVPSFSLLPQAKGLKEVTVIAKKPFIEQKPGKTVLNVEASPTNAGLTALELLEKSPGVSVDNDGNISLKGKQGVMILIDGKPTYMSGADLTNLLKNMQSSGLEQIEIMTNPPAKYDASGNSGIINIKTKKGLVKGMNGSASANYTQGLYGRYNGSLNLNYRNNKLNIFGGYNGGKYEGFNKLTLDRKFYENDNTTIKGLSDQESRPHFVGIYNSLKLGADYYFSKKTVAGIVFNGGINDNSDMPTSTSFVRFADGSVDYKIGSTGDNTRLSKNLSTNVNLKHTFDSTGREITVDLDNAFYNTRNNTRLNTQIFNAADIKLGEDVILKGFIPSDISIYSAKADYSHPFKSGLKLEAGVKSSYVKTDNEVEYLRNSGSDWRKDDRSNHFVYNENINAAYAILSKSIKKWALTAGLRLENTIAKGHQVSNDSSFKRNYTNLFPNIGVGYNASEKNQINFSYSRRITRPDYDALNPFVFFLDSLTYGQGNPYLQPQFTHNFELSHTFKRFLTTTLNYTQTNDIITQMLKQDTEKKVTYQTRENFSSMKQVGLAVMANFAVAKWWNMNIYTNVFNNHYTGIYQNGLKNDPIDIEFTSFMGNMTNSFTIGKKGLTGEVSGWYRTKAAEGLLVANKMYAVNAALSQTLFKKKATLKVGIRDIFFTQQFRGYAKYSDVDVNVFSRRDSRQVNATFTYRFGKKNIAPARRKSGGAEAEQNRVKTSE
jgi:iron complex outermembrane receptor protein